MEQSGADLIDPEARYANYFSIGQAACEIVFEFAQFYEGDREPHAHTRIITTPIHANKFLALLSDSLQKYQAQYGPIAEAPNE